MRKRSFTKSQWDEAKSKYGLTDEQLVKARQLGLNPKNISKWAPNKHEPWKVSVAGRVEQLYAKSRPVNKVNSNTVRKSRRRLLLYRRLADLAAAAGEADLATYCLDNCCNAARTAGNAAVLKDMEEFRSQLKQDLTTSPSA